MRISIIIPIYKVEDYLERCISSIVNQTYKDLEIILVDDGSPDRCPEICNEWSEKDSRIRVVHKENGGLSSARNVGIEIATGDYIFFLDSDDDIPIESISFLVELVYKHPEVDLVQGNLEVVGNRINVWKIKDALPEFIGNKEEAKRTILNNELFPWPAVNKLYRTSFLRDNNLKFREMIIHEDDHFVFYLAKFVKSIAFCRNITYRYYIRDNSIMTANRKDKSKQSILFILNDWIEHIDCVEKQAQMKTIFKYLHLCYCWGNYDKLMNIHHITTKLAQKGNLRQKLLLLLWRYMPLRYKPRKGVLSYILRNM